MISSLLAVIEVLLVMVFFIPSGIFMMLTGAIFPFVLSFILFIRKANKYNDSDAMKYALLAHLFIILNYVAYLFNPGTDDSFKDLDKVFNSVLIGAFCTFIAIIFIVKFYVSIGRIQRELNKEEELEEKEEQHEEINEEVENSE